MSSAAPITYELAVHAGSKKPEIIAWLKARGIDSFVEGTVDGIDVPFDYTGNDLDPFVTHGGEDSPIVLYKYEREPLADLAQELAADFGKHLVVTIKELQTSVWQEGWKESFKPIRTKRFYVHPPWEAPDGGVGLLPLEVEPGMAFGTGQHATTKLCLGVMEELIGKRDKSATLSVLDVGTGTGILAIAAAKLGCQIVEGYDIDTDSILAATDNATRNDVTSIKFVHSSHFVPRPEGYGLVVANILSVVLKQIMPQLAQFTATGGELLMSGILAEERDEMTELAAKFDLRLLGVEELEDWILLRLAKNGR